MAKDIVDVKVVDAQFYDISLESFKRIVQQYAPDFVGISLLTTEYKDALDIAAAAVKEVFPIPS